MIQSFEDYLKEVKPVLDDSFNREISFLLGESDAGSLDLLLATLKGGKRIRGCLSCLVSHALGGSLESAVPGAVAIELIHAASLIHDDFVDQDTTRRNLPATWTLAGARRAVLLGDLIFASTIERMNELGREAGLVVSQAIAQVSRGAFHERLDPFLLAKEIASDQFDEKIYERIISLKTGVLFGAACRLGAVAAGAKKDVVEKLLAYGLQIGEAYQVADDLMEVKHHLSIRSIGPKETAALTPALSYFIKGIRLHLVPFLEGSESELDDEMVNYFQVTEKLMEGEIEKRLHAAASKITGGFPKNAYTELMRQTPWDLVRMFNEP